MNDLEISGDALTLLTSGIPNTHIEVLDHSYQDELFEMFQKYRTDLKTGDEDEEELYDAYKELIHNTLSYAHNSHYDEILQDFDEYVKGYDYVKICELMKDDYGEDLDILDYQMIFRLCLTHPDLITKSFDRLFKNFEMYYYEEYHPENIFNHLCRYCDNFETYGVEKCCRRVCDSCSLPSVIKLQAIFRGHNQRWRCPLFMLIS
tara:strand:- start:280 stop:894 length:615 start_codon:yes stop_codon:yes gene_type:complete